MISLWTLSQHCKERKDKENKYYKLLNLKFLLLWCFIYVMEAWGKQATFIGLQIILFENKSKTIFLSILEAWFQFVANILLSHLSSASIIVCHFNRYQTCQKHSSNGSSEIVYLEMIFIKIHLLLWVNSDTLCCRNLRDFFFIFTIKVSFNLNLTSPNYQFVTLDQLVISV